MLANVNENHYQLHLQEPVNIYSPKSDEIYISSFYTKYIHWFTYKFYFKGETWKLLNKTN